MALISLLSLSFCLCKVIAFHNPDKKNEIIEVADIIAKTREVLGVHYKSDNLFSKYIVDELVKVKEIKDIYFNPKNFRKYTSIHKNLESIGNLPAVYTLLSMSSAAKSSKVI